MRKWPEHSCHVPIAFLQVKWRFLLGNHGTCVSHCHKNYNVLMVTHEPMVTHGHNYNMLHWGCYDIKSKAHSNRKPLMMILSICPIKSAAVLYFGISMLLKSSTIHIVKHQYKFVISFFQIFCILNSSEIMRCIISNECNLVTLPMFLGHKLTS